MTDWIESRTNLARHRKTRRLAELLEIPRPLAVGYLTCWWHRVMEESPEGDLSTWTAADIADAALYEGDPDAFRQALIDADFLEPDGHGGQRPHDWDDYAGRIVERRRADAERKRAFRGRQSQPSASAGRPADIHVAEQPADRTSGVPDPPDRTGPDRPTGPDSSRRAPDEEALIEAFYEELGVETHALTGPMHRQQRAVAKDLLGAGATPAEARRFVAWCRAGPYRPVPSDLRVYEQKRAQFLAGLEPVPAGVGPPVHRNGVDRQELADLQAMGAPA